MGAQNGLELVPDFWANKRNEAAKEALYLRIEELLSVRLVRLLTLNSARHIHELNAFSCYTIDPDSANNL